VKMNLRSMPGKIISAFCVVLACQGAVLANECVAPEHGAIDLAKQLAAAHGGLDKWSRLRTFYVDRVHQGVTYGDPNRPFEFNITADYRTRRIYQTWFYPDAKLAWNGEIAWADRPSGGRPPRAIMSTGFFIANLPWLTFDEHASLGEVGCRIGIVPGVRDTDEFWTLEVNYEADVVRKPTDYVGPRDRWLFLIEPDSGRLAGAEYYRTWGGDLDGMGFGPAVSEYLTVYVPQTFIEADGLLWPNRFSTFALDGTNSAYGEFKNYAFDVPFDERRMMITDTSVVDVSTPERRSQ
jgi:hypothetical protein